MVRSGMALSLALLAVTPLMAGEVGTTVVSEPGYVNYDYPASRAGVPFDPMRIGYVTHSGIYEPGYVNYQYRSLSSGEEKEAVYGKWLESGVFEPTYLNYRVDSD